MPKIEEEKVANSPADVEYNDDGQPNPDYVSPKVEGEEAAPEAQGEGDDEEENIEFNDTIDPAIPPEIPVRKSALQNIIARKNTTIEKLKSNNEDGADVELEDDDLNLSDDARSAIDTRVNKALSPVVERLAKEAEKEEFDALFKAEPEAEKFKNHIKAYMTHDAYKGVPPAVIYHHLAWNVAQSIGAKKKKAADLEANQTRGAGRIISKETPVDGLPSADEIANMSDADFEKLENRARMGEFVKK